MTLPEKYTRPAMLLHWLVAVLIIFNVLMIWTVDYLPKSAERPAVDLHKSIGITVLGLVILRVLWRLTHRPPPLPAAYPKWERLAAHSAHAALYVLIFLQPLTGWIHDSAWKGAPEHPLNLFWVIPWFRIGAVQNLDPATKEQMHALFGQLHTSFAYVLIAVFVVHVAGALKHQFLDKEPELQRMWPGE
jgi:cytochrome b561